MRLWSRWKQRLPSSEGLTEVRKSVSEVPHSRGCWQETSGPQHVGLHSAALSAPVAWRLASCRVGSPSESREPRAAPSDSVSEDSHYQFHCLLFVRSKSIPHSKGKELGFNSRRKEFRSIYLSLWHYTFVISLLSHHHFSEVSRDDALCYFYQSLCFSLLLHEAASLSDL